MFGYRVPAPDEAMLISGGKHAEGVPFRVIVGRGAFIMPFFRKVRFLTLQLLEAEVAEGCVTTQGIGVNVRAVIAFKVGNDDEAIVNAGQRFLSDQNQMTVLTGRIFAGHLRSIVGGMTVEQIVRERQKLATEVLDASKVEMVKIGLLVDSLQIQSIDDLNSGYIEAMGAPDRAAIQRAAQVAQAQADQASKIAQAAANQAASEAEQQSLRKQAEFTRETSVAQAGYRAEVDRAQAEAGQAGPLALAQSQMGVATAQGELEQRRAKANEAVATAQADQAKAQATLRQAQLVAEVVRPAEAEAEKVRISAKADAERQQILAAAAASSNRVTLDQQLITLLPQIVKEAAGGLAGANVTVLNGTDGIGEIVTGLVSQGMAILDTVKGSLNGHTGNGVQPTDRADMQLKVDAR
jgi:uncharacterized membrane protein YqiK